MSDQVVLDTTLQSVFGPSLFPFPFPLIVSSRVCYLSSAAGWTNKSLQPGSPGYPCWPAAAGGRSLCGGESQSASHTSSTGSRRSDICCWFCAAWSHQGQAGETVKMEKLPSAYLWLYILLFTLVLFLDFMLDAVSRSCLHDFSNLGPCCNFNHTFHESS